MVLVFWGYLGCSLCNPEKREKIYWIDISHSGLIVHVHMHTPLHGLGTSYNHSSTPWGQGLDSWNGSYIVALSFKVLFGFWLSVARLRYAPLCVEGKLRALHQASVYGVLYFHCAWTVWKLIRNIQWQPVALVWCVKAVMARRLLHKLHMT